VKSVEESDPRRGKVSLEFLHFKSKDGTEKPKLMMFANEHAREMITGEVALKFVQDMCAGSGVAGEARNLLETLVVVNSNPFSRQVAEGGEFCRRANPNDVDINRNWDDKFGLGSHLDQTAAGPSAFSEVETRLLRRIADEFQPTAYFSVHSGFKGILYSNRYSVHKTGLDFADRMFSEINRKYCNCPQGPADTTLHYQAAGTSLDYIADKVPSTRFSVAFELWPPASYDPEDDKDDDDSSKHASSFMQIRTVNRRAKVAAEMTEEEIQDQDPSWCLHSFNPVSRSNFDSTVNNFRQAFAELALSLGKDAEWKKIGAE